MLLLTNRSRARNVLFTNFVFLFVIIFVIIYFVKYKWQWKVSKWREIQNLLIVTGIACGNEKCGLVNEIDVIKVIDSFLDFVKAASMQREFWIVWILCGKEKVLPLSICSTKEMVGIKTKRWYIAGETLNNFWQIGTNTKRRVYCWLVSHLDVITHMTV